MTRISFIDTTLRDGHQCLWATRMSTPMMLPVIDAMDRAGFDVLEIIGAVQFDTCVRFLNENPWARLRTLCGRIRRTKRQAIIRSKCALNFELQPDDINRLWVELLIKNGIEQIVAFDGLHDLDNIEVALKHAKKLGAKTVGWLIFSISPVHTDAFYAKVARDFIDRCEIDTLMIEDTSGILTPERARTLIPAIRREIGAMRLGLHTHNLAGLAQLTYIEAVGLGIDNLYTCIAPIADGNAPPAIQTTVRNLRHLGLEDTIDDGEIAEISAYFEALAIQEDKPLGRPLDYDAAIFEHQIPGGVMSNLASQLQSAGHGDKLQAVLDECGTVREELGWPIQVTPFSQFIGVQATLNVTAGERYTRVPDAVKKYALGYYGKTMAPVDPNVLDRIVENGSRAIAIEPPAPEPALPGLRKAYPGADDEELMLRHAFPAAAVDAVLNGTGNNRDYSRLGTPLVELVRGLASRADLETVSIRTEETIIELKRNAGD